MDRYRNIRTLRNAQGIEYYRGTKYPEIPLSENDIYVLTDFGDRLDLLANQFYGDVTLYWIIAAANPNTIGFGSLNTTPGLQLRIPVDISGIIDSYNKLNAL